MYRVELKVRLGQTAVHGVYMFLMYRVELKDLQKSSLQGDGRRVPNVPCGVERLLREV